LSANQKPNRKKCAAEQNTPIELPFILERNIQINGVLNLLILIG